MKTITYIIIAITVISCSNLEGKKIKGSWTIDAIEENGQDLMSQYTSNLISFKKGQTCTLPQTKENNNTAGKWSLTKENDIYYLKIEADGNKLAGKYRINFENDNEKKLLKVSLSTNNIKIICSKLLNKFEE